MTEREPGGDRDDAPRQDAPRHAAPSEDGAHTVVIRPVDPGSVDAGPTGGDGRTQVIGRVLDHGSPADAGTVVVPLPRPASGHVPAGHVSATDVTSPTVHLPAQARPTRSGPPVVPPAVVPPQPGRAPAPSRPERFPAGPVGPGGRGPGGPPAPRAVTPRFAAPPPVWGAAGPAPAPAAAPYPVPAAESPPSDFPYPEPPSDGGAPPEPPAATPAPAGRRRFARILVALVAVVALVGAGIGTWFLLRSTGGATPAEATHLLADDLQSADLPGAISRLHPDEVALGGELGTTLRDELVRLQIVRPDATLGTALKGITFADLRFDDAAVELVRPNVAITKLVGGTVTVDRDADDAGLLTDSFRQLVHRDGASPRAPEVVDIAQVVAEQGHPVRLATVQVDGHWFVSLAYTLADSALQSRGATWPQGAVAPRGAPTPEGALRDGVAAVVAQDARRLVELAPPTELAVVHDLGPLIVERAGPPQTAAHLVDLTTTQTAVAGGTAVSVDKIVIADDTGSQATVARDGDCLVTTPASGSPTRECADDLAAQRLDLVPGSTDPALRDIAVRVARAALGTRVVVVAEGGQYYVSPARTLAGLGVDVLHTLQPADLARLVTAGT